MSHDESKAKLGFIWTGQVFAPDGELIYTGGPDQNIIPQDGIDHLVGLIRGTTTLISDWYVGIGESDYVPTASTTSADLQSAVGECTAYSESTRRPWNDVYDGTSIITNLASRAEFTLTSEKRLYTGFLAADSTKGGASGVLLSIARFSSPYDVPAGSTFRLGVSITMLPEI